VDVAVGKGVTDDVTAFSDTVGSGMSVAVSEGWVTGTRVVSVVVGVFNGRLVQAAASNMTGASLPSHIQVLCKDLIVCPSTVCCHWLSIYLPDYTTISSPGVVGCISIE